MFKQLSFLITLLITILFFTQCKEETTKSEEKAGISAIEKPVETAKETLDKIDSVQLKTPVIAETKRVSDSKEIDLVKESETKKVESIDNNKKSEVPKKKKKRAKMQFGKTTFQFGKIKEGDKIEHNFKFKNTGNAPLVIKNVEVSCGCTFPSYPFIPIKPGEEGVIGVTFNSEHKIGRQKPIITVITNARPRTHKLYLEGFVE